MRIPAVGSYKQIYKKSEVVEESNVVPVPVPVDLSVRSVTRFTLLDELTYSDPVAADSSKNTASRIRGFM
jgi:hypothetical protein